jgi:hypothetical protein
MKKLLLATGWLAIIMEIAVAQTVQVPNDLFGINYYMPQYIGTQHYNGDASEPAILQKLKSAGIKIYRLGGNQWDRDGKSANDYITAIANIKGQDPNAIFIVQIPVKANTFGITATDAATIVSGIRAVYPDVIYFAIGNEWDKYESPHNQIDKIHEKFTSFATAMKQAEPSIKIVGPSPNSFSSGNILQQTVGSLGGIYDLTGKDANGNFYLDVISWNTYSPLLDNTDLDANNFNTRRNRVIEYPGGTGTSDLPNRLNQLDGWITQANSFHSRTGTNDLKFAVTEMNINYYNPPQPDPVFTSTDRLKNTVFGIGAASFINGQFRADMYHNLLKYGKGNCLFMTPWSIMTKSNNRDTEDFALFDDQFPNQKERSVFWHMQLMAQHFPGGNFHSYFSINSHKSFGYSKPNEHGVMILNQDQAFSANEAGARFSINGNNGSPISITNPNQQIIYKSELLVMR